MGKSTCISLTHSGAQVARLSRFVLFSSVDMAKARESERKTRGRLPEFLF